MRRSFTDMDDMLKKKNQPIKRAKQTLGEYDTCNDPECQICSQWLEHKHKYSLTRIAYQLDKDAAKDLTNNTLYLSSDMQKVILLPRLPGYKLCLFTKRLVVINPTFAPINKEEVHNKKSLGIVWHEGIMGRKDEDVCSAFIKCFRSSTYRDYNHIVIWLDNCAGQKRNWTLITSLIGLVNSEWGPQTITLKYFTVGHTFMSADSFHAKVEKEMNKLKMVCD